MTEVEGKKQVVSTNSLMVLGGIALGCIIFFSIFLPIILIDGEEESSTDSAMEIALRVLKSTPLIDGHNDLPNNVRELLKNQLESIDFNSDLSEHPVWGSSNFTYTDIPRLKQGHVGAQFWIGYGSCDGQFKDSMEQCLDQIDVIRRFIAKYSDSLELVTSAQGIEDAFTKGKIASLIGIEGGQTIDNRLAALRLFYKLGVRYLTLNHMCNTPWGDSSSVVDIPTIETKEGGLSEFGKAVIEEMNRLGMIIDLSHSSVQTQKDAIAASKAPVIFSHANAYQVHNHYRNVHDDVLLSIKETNGIVMVNFYPGYLKPEGETAVIQDVINHMNHIRQVAGVDHIGIGSDFDGINTTPVGLEDVSKYPNLIAALAGDTENVWSEQDLQKIVGLNFIRVMKQVEQIRDELASTIPVEDIIPIEDIGNNTDCMTLTKSSQRELCL